MNLYTDKDTVIITSLFKLTRLFQQSNTEINVEILWLLVIYVTIIYGQDTEAYIACKKRWLLTIQFPKSVLDDLSAWSRQGYHSCFDISISFFTKPKWKPT